jgi:hypothetical protein
MNFVNHKHLFLVALLFCGVQTTKTELSVNISTTTEDSLADRTKRLEALSKAVEERDLATVNYLVSKVNLEEAELVILLKSAYASIDACDKKLEVRGVKNIPHNMVNIAAWSLLSYFLAKHIIAEGYANVDYALSESPIGLPVRIFCLGGCLKHIADNLVASFSKNKNFANLMQACRIQKILHDSHAKAKMSAA